MASMRATLAYELFRPTFARHAQALGIASLVGVLWVGALFTGSGSPLDSELVPATTTPSVVVTTKAGELDVPSYYFPNEAVGTDKYLSARDGDCGGSAVVAPLDYPEGWLRP